MAISLVLMVLATKNLVSEMRCDAGLTPARYCTCRWQHELYPYMPRLRESEKLTSIHHLWQVEGNPCLAYTKMVVFPWFGQLSVSRKEAAGGDKCGGCLLGFTGRQAVLRNRCISL